MIELASAQLLATVSPEQGASIADLSCMVNGNWVPVLQTASAGEPSHPALTSGLFIMLPFANRAARNLLTAGEAAYQLLRNTAEPLALHGTGWERAWTVLDRTEETLCLGLKVDAGSYAFPFAADLQIDLSETTLKLQCRLTNTGIRDIPAGIGFHPWFPRSARTRLRFAAERFWLEGPDHLPTSPILIPPELDFAQGAALPATWRNNLYSGWSSKAEIEQPDLGYRLLVEASHSLDNLMFYCPPGSSRFALEPQSHGSGFTIVSELPTHAVGLKCLAPSESMKAAVSFSIVPF